MTLDDTIESLRLFADPTRVRLASLLEGNELSVAEITQITQLPQSRVSTHLGKLREAGIVRDRREGASSFYAFSEATMSEAVRQLWSLVGATKDEPLLRTDRIRCRDILRAREHTGSWPETVAGQMERHYSPGRTWEATLLGLLPFLRLGDVLDAGAGDGTIAALLATRCHRVTCLDRSPKLLRAARQRLAAHDNVNFALGDLHALPLSTGRFDHVLLLNVLTYVREPVLALCEAARVLRPGGDLTISTLARHDHEQITGPYGHINRGFRPDDLRDMLSRRAGLRVERCEITSSEKRPPHFAVISACARKPDRPSASQR
jgi:SAM-dependent methyltransferase